MSRSEDPALYERPSPTSTVILVTGQVCQVAMRHSGPWTLSMVLAQEALRGHLLALGDVPGLVALDEAQARLTPS
jgi:hypothetical protein